MGPQSSTLFAQACETASKHHREGKTGFALGVLSGALYMGLSAAVTTTADASEADRFFLAIRMHEAINEFSKINGSAYDALLSGAAEGAAVTNDPTLLCLAWFCGVSDAARSMLEILRDDRVRRVSPLTRFWAEFARGLIVLHDKGHYEAEELKVRGYEYHWKPYLRLISALSKQSGVAIALSEVEQSFQRRNQDKRLLDWRTIDGDGKRPVRWDFRREALFRCHQSC